MKVRPQGAGCRENRFFWQLFYYRQYSRFVIAWATIFCFYCPASFSLHLAFFHSPGNSSDVFTNLLPLFCPGIVLSLSSWKRKQISYWSKTGFFPQFSNWKRNHNKCLLEKIVDSEFEIGETIWWAYRQLGKLTFTIDYSLESICLSSTHKWKILQFKRQEKLLELLEIG